MRPRSLLFLLLLVPLLLAAAAAAAEQRREMMMNHRGRGGGHAAAAPEAQADAFYHKVGRFAVMVHSMWNEIKPVPKLERVVSVSTRPAEGGGVDYLLVLRVAPPLGTCEALVWDVPGEGSQDWKLKYFKPAPGA